MLASSPRHDDAIPEAGPTWEKLSPDEIAQRVANFKDDVLSKLVDAFYEVKEIEGWTRRDIAGILGLNESQVSHILNGRRSNLTLATIAALAVALRKRPELALIDIRPKGNKQPLPSNVVDSETEIAGSARSATLSHSRIEVSALNFKPQSPILQAARESGQSSSGRSVLTTQDEWKQSPARLRSESEATSGKVPL